MRQMYATRRCGFWGLGLALLSGCGAATGMILPNESVEPIDQERFELLARLAHISDAQIVDEESPGRLASLSLAANLVGAAAWRPQEAYSTQLLDGMIRTINKIHVVRHTVDFVVHTGDALDNAQANELNWFITAFDGGTIDPRSGPDDRDPVSRPVPSLDPHHPFEAQGLYRHGDHGDAPTIPWYSVIGNHDRYAVGVFPIVTDLFGRRISPIAPAPRLGLFLPAQLDPVGAVAWAPITPANPGPPGEFNFPQVVQANPDRRFINNREFVEAHWASESEPPGHGFTRPASGRTWYSVSPTPGVRLIALNSAAPLLETPTLIYSEGAVSAEQIRFLGAELGKAAERGEVVIVATHHSPDSFDPTIGTSISGAAFVELLNRYPAVRLHLCGHTHEHRVIDRGGYVEVTTAAVIDAPQEGRVVEVWRDPVEGDVELRYWTFSHLEQIELADPDLSSLLADPLMPMRRVAASLAGVEVD